MKLFNIDSPVYRFMQRLWDVFRLNLMWLLFSLPVVTIGISTIAAADVTLRMTEEREGHVVHDFIKAFKANWKQGIPMSFVTLLSIYAIWMDIQLINAVEDGTMFLIMTIVSAYIFIFGQIYVYPLLARYDNSIINSLKNSFELGMKYFGRTVLLLIVLALEIAVIFWNTTTLFAGALIGPACVIYTISGTAMYIFRDMEKIPGSTREKEDDTDTAESEDTEDEE